MHHRNRGTRPLGWCLLLLALAVSGLTPGGVWAQPPAASEVMIPVGATGGVPTTAGAMIKKIEVIPPIVDAKLSFDAKTIEISGLAPGFAQVRLLDNAGAVLQVINVQVLPPDLEIPFGEGKIFQSPPGTTIQDVRVTTPDIVKFAIAMDKKQVEVIGSGLGTTKLTIIDSKGGFQVFNVVVVVSAKYLQAKIREAVPSATVYPVMIAKGGFILNGTVEKSEDIIAVLETAKLMGVTVINALRVPGVMQVQLDVVIAEVSRTELREMSFSWFNNGKVHFIGSALSPANSATTQSIITIPGVTSSLNAAPGNLVLGFVNNKQTFFGFLEALRNEGLAKFLACPKLVTMSGKPATFLSGGRLAIPEPSGLGTTAVRYEDFGTQLNFLPLVLGNGKILIECEPRVDLRNDANGTTINGTAVPGFDSERLHATVELEAGQTFALGGLIQHQVNATTSKVPLLGDLPFLGAAFRTVTHNQVETELLILVTPYLVDPMACNQLPKAVPGQETRIPDDFELFLEGILEAPRGQRDIFPGGRYKAAYLNGPSAGTFPCGVPSGTAGPQWGQGGGHGGCSNGSCGTGSCGNGGCNSYVPANVQQHPMATPTAAPPMIPPMQPKNLPMTGYGQDSNWGNHGGEVNLPAVSSGFDQGAVMPAGAPAMITPPVGNSDN